MKFSILLDIVFDLLSKRRVTAAYLAEKHAISPRTVYRYVEIIAEKVPVLIKRGRSGGITLSDGYKLPVSFMSAEEYGAAIEALGIAYAQNPEARFLTARKKLSAESKTSSRELFFTGNLENVLIEGLGTAFSEKLRVLESCMEELAVAEVEYAESTGEKVFCRIETHLLVFDRDIWYAYAFCHTQRAFRLFSLGRIRTVVKTDEIFRKRPFERENIPLLRHKETQNTEIRFEISEEALSAARDFFGVENIRTRGGKRYADVTLHDDEALPAKILGFGTGIKVISPPSLKRRVAALVAELSNLYSQ